MSTTISALVKTLQKQRASAQKEVDQIERALAAVQGLSGASSGVARRGKKRRKMSASARAKIAAAQKKRWAKQKIKAKPAKKKRKMSAAGRAAIRAAQKARWAKIKAAKK